MRILRTLYHNICSLIYWFPVIWRDRDFDYQFTLDIMEHSLRRLYKFLSGPSAVAMQHKSHMQHLHVCLLLLERMKGSYIDKVRKTEPRHIVGNLYADWNLDDVEYLEEQDWQYLWELLSKYMRTWWD